MPCLFCGSSLEGRHPRTKYCSPLCKSRFDQARRGKAKKPNPGRCAHCETSLAGYRVHAKFCSRACKTAASDRRRVEDGRDAELGMRRRARKNENPIYRFTPRDWRRMVARYRGCCAYCGKPSLSLHKDHVIPISRGGSHGVGNILPACPDCNLRKSAKLLIEFRLRGKGVIL